MLNFENIGSRGVTLQNDCSTFPGLRGNNPRSISPRQRICCSSQVFVVVPSTTTSGRGGGDSAGRLNRSPRRRSTSEGVMDLVEWQQGVVRGGTLRPGRSSSFVNVRPKEIDRPSSKMSEPGELGAYRRSLKLLGLDDDGLGSDSGRPHSATSRPKTKGAQPKLKTRLERRTVSTEDLRSALTLHDAPKIAPSRGLVSRAVYEAWYFKKVEHARQLAEAKMQQEKIAKWQMENEKLEKQRKGQLSYDEWLRRKEEEKNRRKPANETGRKKGGPLTVKRPVSREEAEAAFEKWKMDKAKSEAKSIDDETRRKLKEEEAERKREEAEKAFESWKKRRDEERKRAAQKEAEEREANERALQQQQEAKQKDADASFRAWSQAKAKEAAEKLRKTRILDERKVKEATQKQTERRYEATQAFQEWLDHILEREERRRML